MASPLDSILPPGFIAAYRNMAAQELGRLKLCLHPDAPNGCRGNVINAHSIQRSGPLGKIVDAKNKVLTFGKIDGKFDDNPRSIGWREASTFSGFCSRHDDETFAPIEKYPFEAKPHQCALVGYRSICFETYQKTSALHFRQQQIQLGRELRSTVGFESGLEYLADVKKKYEAALKTAVFDDLAYVVYRFSGSLSVASAGLTQPDWDLAGARIQDLSIFEEPMQGLTYGIVLDGLGFAVVFSWPRDFTLITGFLEQFSRLNSEELTTALLIFMFAYSSNTYFSDTWWQGLRIAQRFRLKHLALTPVQYNSPVNYKCGRLADWQLREVVMFSKPTDGSAAQPR